MLSKPRGAAWDWRWRECWPYRSALHLPLIGPWRITPCRIAAQPSCLPAEVVVDPVAAAAVDPVVVVAGPLAVVAPVAVAVACALEATAASAMPVRASTAAQAGPPVAGATMPGLVREPEGPEGLP